MAETKNNFDDIRAKAMSIKDGFGERDALYEDVDEAYLLKEVDLPSYAWIKKTISPDARNKTIGAVRLLTAADPKWKVPRDKNKDSLDEEVASNVEKAAEMIWNHAGKMRKQPIHYTATLSAMLYGQIDIAIADMREVLKDEKNPVRKRRMERLANRSPLHFEVLSPRTCYPIYDAFGLASHFTYREMKVIDVISRWGSAAEEQLASKKKTEVVNYCEYWDDEIHAVWIDGQKEPLAFKPHELPVIPIASAIIEGGELFEEPEYQRQPFLYTMLKSHLHERQSLMLTLMYSNVFSTGANPTQVYKTNDISKSLDVDYEVPGGLVKILPNEDLRPMEKQVIDPALRELYQVAEGKADESTMYSQTLGEPLGGNAPFSMVSLLSQAGRLPLVPYQRMLSAVISDAMIVGLDLLRHNGGGKFAVGPADTGIELDLSTVPEDIEITASLEIDLPQDEFTQARIAMEVVKSGLVSKERARDKYLGIGQSDDEDRQIWNERYMDTLSQAEFQKKVMEMQMQAQEQQGLPPEMLQGQPGQMPPQMSPEIMAQLQQMKAQQMGQQPGMNPEMMAGMQSAQEGLPMQMPMQPGMNPEEGLPPEMMGGM